MAVGSSVLVFILLANGGRARSDMDLTGPLCNPTVPVPSSSIQRGEQRALALYDPCVPRFNDLYLAQKWKVVSVAGTKPVLVVVEKQ
jgi:hypothetical protein